MTFVVLVALLAQTPTCGGCHEPEARLELQGAHAKSASCVDCHGGKPAEKDRDLAHSDGFTGKILRTRVPELCARCHSDVRRMNPYGLPTDQLAHYLTSRHGEALARGDTDVAVCIDCHGVHGIRRVRDPTGPVHPANVPTTCGRCHSDARLMAKHNLPATAESLYRASVHGELLAKGDAAAPQCATCHGNHGAVPPGFDQVTKVCGKCHVQPREYFEKSPHAFYAKDGSFKGCVVCHENHRILRSVPEMTGRCAPCHEENDPEIRKRNDLALILAGGRTEFHQVKERLEGFTRSGFHTDDEQALLEEAHTALLRLSPLQHTLDVTRVRGASDELASVVHRIDEQLDRKAAVLRVRTLALIPIWLFLGMLAWLLRMKRKVVLRHDG
jgi:hypothetical protein